MAAGSQANANLRSWPELAGFRPLGDLKGACPGMAIFRRFRNAATLDLEYRQAELQHAIVEWANTVHSDEQSGNDVRTQYDTNFFSLLTSVNQDNAEFGNQRRSWGEVSNLLWEYCSLCYPLPKSN